MNAISSVRSEGGGATVDRFTPEIIGRILRFLDLTPIEEYRLSQVSKPFRAAMALTRGGPLPSIEKCGEELALTLRMVQDPKTQQVLTQCQKNLTALNKTQESSLSKEGKLFEEVMRIAETIEEIDPYLMRVQVHRVRSMPIMQMLEFYRDFDRYGKSRKFEEWAEEGNFRVPLGFFKALSGNKKSLFAYRFIEALIKRGDIERVLEVLPSVTKSSTRSYAIFSLCKGYIQQGRPQGVVPLARQLKSRVNAPSDQITREHVIGLLLERRYIDQAVEIVSLLPKSHETDLFLVQLADTLHNLKHPKREEVASQIADPKKALELGPAFETNPHPFVNCLFLLCKMYIRENQFQRAFALMQHIMEQGEKLKRGAGASLFQKVAALFVQKREFRKVGR